MPPSPPGASTSARILAPARLAAVRRTGLLDTPAEEAFDRLARLAATLLGTPFAFVTVVDDVRSFWKSCIGIAATDPAGRQNTVGDSFCQYVIGLDTELIIGDTTADARTRDNPSIERMGVLAWAGFPIRSPDGHVLGTFCAVDTVRRDWTPHDVEVLDTLAHAAGGEIALRIALEDAREATRQAQAATLEALGAADEAAMLSRTLQESLLPPRLPVVAGLDLAARYLRGGRGAEVLGDFYDVFHSPRGTWGVVVGDVAGKGPQAAKTTALARWTLRAAAVRSASPSANLAALNTALHEWFSDDGQFLTAVYAALRPHPQGFTVRVSCGGHDPALVRRSSGTVETVGRPGIVLGCVRDAELTEQRTLLRPGDSLIMYTDGVTEARNRADRALFGTERLSDLITATSGDATALAVAIETAVLDFSGRSIADDTAIVVVQVPDA
ncbi:SpoIIE family protein phosphatase [Dactylosporangium vinaceum]|nr:SpoIIE family protein phosphatase [Dactylosporangium vinaceum]